MSLRVVAGSARGRRLGTPAGDAVRPTTDRVREAVFNALGSLDAVVGAHVLDLFAGSGALGIEALSRGAASATFVDRAGPALAAVRANLEATGLAPLASVVRSDALDHLAALVRAEGGTGAAAASGAPPPDLVLADPPYAYERWDDLWAALARAAPGAIVVAESDRPMGGPPGAAVLRERAYGGTVVTIIGLPDVVPQPEPTTHPNAGPAPHAPPEPEDLT